MGLLRFWSLTHASVDVFWSRRYDQEGLCSRLYSNIDSHYSLSCIEMLKWLTLVDFVVQDNKNSKIREITQVGNTY